MLDKPRMLTVHEVADEYRRHPVTIRIALQSGALHGRQPMVGGKWLIEEPCADAWSQGVECGHAAAMAELIELRRTA